MLFYFTGELARGGTASWLQQNNFSWHRWRPTLTSRSRGTKENRCTPPPPLKLISGDNQCFWSGTAIIWLSQKQLRIGVENIDPDKKLPHFFPLFLIPNFVQFTYFSMFHKIFLLNWYPTGRGLQRDVVYLGWPISPNTEGGGRSCGVSANPYSCTQEPK